MKIHYGYFWKEGIHASKIRIFLENDVAEAFNLLFYGFINVLYVHVFGAFHHDLLRAIRLPMQCIHLSQSYIYFVGQ